jgi:2-dehydro-3-deoxygalactonokinase
MSSDLCCICVDMGTTTTRAWLVHNGAILERCSLPAGARNSAQDKDSVTISKALATLVGEIIEISAERGLSPTVILGAGMITSSLGLMEIVHLPAPASIADLHRHAVCRTFPEISKLPLFLVPGVRTAGEDAEAGDAMRGEETLCVGLIECGAMAPGCTVLNLGSHWKAIATDQRGLILSSVTTLSGELMFVAQANTILAGSLPAERLNAPSPTWIRRGANEERRNGLTRALFCVRLLHLAGQGTPEERLSFLAGLTISNTMVSLRQSLGKSVVITGEASIASAWKILLEDEGFSVTICSGEDLEASLVRGLLTIYDSG